jgi:hypothetical protein
MATHETSNGIPPDLEADVKAAYEAYAAGRPVDSEVARRIHEWVAQRMEEDRRVRGVIDDETFQALLDDDEET